MAGPGVALGAEQYWDGTSKSLNAGDVWTINADSTVERTHDVNLTGALTINGDATDGGILNIGSNGVLRVLSGATLSTTGTINVGGVLDLSYGKNNLDTVYTAAATASDGTTPLRHLTDGADIAYRGGKIALGSGAVLKMPRLVIVDNNTVTPGLTIASDATIKTDSLVLTPANAGVNNSFTVNAGNLVLNGAAASLTVNGAATPGALNLHDASASPVTLTLGDAALTTTPTGIVHGDVNVGASSAHGRLEAAAGTWRVTGSVVVANGSSLTMGEAGGPPWVSAAILKTRER